MLPDIVEHGIKPEMWRYVAMHKFLSEVQEEDMPEVQEKLLRKLPKADVPIRKLAMEYLNDLSFNIFMPEAIREIGSNGVLYLYRELADIPDLGWRIRAHRFDCLKFRGSAVVDLFYTLMTC